MRERLEQRLAELKADFEEGQQRLANLEAQGTNLRNKLLRISGAIQVLEEELSPNQRAGDGLNVGATGANGSDPDESGHKL